MAQRTSDSGMRARSKLKRSAPRPIALEPRIMYDGAAVDTAAAAAAAAAKQSTDAATEASTSTEAGIDKLQVPIALEPATSTSREIVFVDARVPDYQQLVSGARSDVQVVVIQADEDGLAVIDSTLSGQTDITSIHVVTHGSEGIFTLGSTVVDADTLAARQGEVSAWSSSLTSSADILLYGCDVAASDAGKSLVNQLAELTGADVAASVDDTGGAVGGGNWALEYSTGSIEAASFLTTEAALSYQDRLASFNLSGSTGWTAVMFGTNKDPVGDSQAGAADTDIVGDASHGSLYVAFDDNGTVSTADDSVVYRLRIDNPTSSTYFGGVAVVGMDVNLDGRLDVFVSVDGRNNGQAIKILDPGTGANISPNTTSTSPLPTGWLANNGVYSFSASNYSVVAVSASTDPNWNGDNDLGNDGKTDVFVSWRVSLSDIATVLAKPSLVDRSGNYGPRGSTGISGFSEDTTVQYVNFTQTQTGPINGDLNGVGASYDKNATFTSLDAFTPQMTASEPVSAGPTITIDDPAGGNIGNDGIWSANEDGSVTLSGTSSNLTQGTVVTVTVSDGSVTKTATGTVQANGQWSANFAGGESISGLSDGTLTIQASADPDGNAGTSNDIHDTTSILHDRTAPTVTIGQLATAVTGMPTITGTSNLPDGSLLTVTIDTDNNPATTDLIYQVMVVSGAWSLNTAIVTPTSGAMPSSGLTSYSKISATATDAAGNSASAVAINHPTVTTVSTNDTTPVISGTWTHISGDVLTVTINGATYTLAPSGNTWSVDLGTATPSSGSLTALSAGNSYSVTATVTRDGTNVSDTTSSEVAITSAPVKSIDITGGTTASGSDTTPTISGTSGNAGGFVIVRLDPSNDGDLSDAVTYSVATDGSGNWTLDTGSATPISGIEPSGGYIGAVGILATDSTGAVSDVQVLTISTPTVAIGSITSAASTDANAQVNNSGGAANYLNATEDNSVTVSGTATDGTTVDLVISDATGNSVSYTNLAVTGGVWSKSGIDLSSLDNGTLTVKATLSNTSINTTNTNVTHDKTPNQIFITNQTTIPKTQATISGSSNLGSGVGLTVTIRNSTDTATVWTGTATTDVSGNWSVTTPNGTNLVGANSGTVIIKVAPTATNTDAAGNITQQVIRSSQAVQNGAANSSDSISIGTIAGDNIISANEIGSGLTITGTTSLTTAATSAFTITVSDGTTTQTATVNSNSGGTWSASLTQAQVQALKNGQLVVTATVNNTTSGIAVSNVTLPTLSLLTPTLSIVDDTPGTATGAVTFTFSFSEAVTGFTASDITVTGGTKGTFSGSGTTYTLVVTPTSSSSGNISVDVASSIATGTSSGRGNAAASTTQPYNTTGAAAAPTLTINADALASSTTPIITGTTSLAAGAPIVITIDPDNNSGTNNSLTYSATVQSDGSWTLDVSSSTPTSGSLPSSGLESYAKITATATNAYGNSTSVTAIDKPAVIAQTTNDSTPTITGTWASISGDSLSVTVTPAGGGSGTTYAVGSGLTVSGNTWSITSDTLTDGSYDVTTTVTRSATTKTDITSGELFIDTAATVDITGGATVTGNDSTPLISGTTTGIPAGTVLTLGLDTDNNGSYDLVYKTTIQADGSWSVNTASATPFNGVFPSSGLDGSIPVQATATDAAGNVGTDTQTLIVDVTPPAIGFTSGTRTPDTTPVISGITDLAAGSSITVDIDPNNDGDWSDQQTYIAIVQANGTWSIQMTNALSGTVTVRASGTDEVGNMATVNTPLTIDLSAPTVTVTPVTTINNDYVADAVEDDAVVISGATTDIADGESLTITITDGTMTISDTATVSGGTWQLAPFNLSALANGQITVTATYVDGGGNSYPATTLFSHDKSATVSIDSISEDTGVIADFVTKDSTISIFGSATASAAVSVVVTDINANVVASFSVNADSQGLWSTGDTGALSAGTYTLFATVGGTTVSKDITIVDATSPTLVASSPADDASSFAVADNVSLTFSKDVQAGSGFISLYKDDGTLVESFNVATGAGDNGGSLSFNGTTGITFNPASDLTLSTGYYVRIDSAAVIDSAGNAYAGIGDSITLNFNTGSGVSAPSQVVNIVEMTQDTGASSNDFITADGSAGRTVSGTISAGLGANEIVEVSFDGGSNWVTATTVGTDWSVTDASSYSADWSIEARITNANSHLSGSVATQNVTLDAAAPIVPAVDVLVTTSTAPTLTGTATVDAGETLTVTVNGATYTVVASSGTWSLDLATATPTSGTLGGFVAGSSYAVTSTVTDAAGNSATDITTNELVIASLDPTQTPAIESMTKDTGASSTDFVTSNGTANRTVSGTLTSSLNVDEVVEVSFDGGTTWNTATSSGTDWSITDAGGHSGSWNIQARVTNTTTNASGPTATQAVVLDESAPAEPVVDTTIATTTPTLTGSAVVAAGEVLSVTVNGATYTVVPTSGTWSLDLATAIPVSGTLGNFTVGSSYAVTAVVTDTAGNIATDVTTNELTIVSPAPTQTPTIESMTKDTGASSTDFITSNGTANRTVAGSLTVSLNVDEVLEVSFDGGTTWSTATTSGTSWSMTDAGAHAGNWSIEARVTNTTTNASGPTVTQAVVLDATAPAVPAVDSIIATTTTPTLTGSATVASGETLSVTVNGATYTVVPSGGTWSLDLATATPVSGTLGSFTIGNSYAVTAVVIDAAGNSATDVTTNELTIAAANPTQMPTIESMSKDTGVSATDFITSNGTANRTVAGSLTSNLSVGEVVEVSFDGGTTWITAVTSGTSWSMTDAGAHLGDWNIEARVTNTTTHASGPVVTQSVVLDTVAPAVPTVNSSIATTPTLTGSATVGAGETLNVTVNGATYTVVPSGGTWSLNLATATPASGTLASFAVGNSYAVTAVITDVAGNSTTDITTNELTIAAANPTQTPTIVSMTQDTGASSADFITSDGAAGRTVSGSLTSSLNIGEVVEVSFDGGATWVTATSSGTDWSVTDTGAHAGDWNIQARITNTSTHASGPAATRAVVLDTSAPAAPAVDAVATTSTPVLTGTATVGTGETLTVVVNGATYVVVPSGGLWSLDLATATPVTGSLGALVPGNSYAVTATVVDLAGNATSDVTTNELTVSSNTPTQTPVIVSMSKDTGSSNTDFITADGSSGRTVSGLLPTALNAGEVVEVSFDGGTTWVTATVSGANWSAADAGSHASSWDIQARVVNTTTHASGPAATRSVVLDSTEPVPPTVNAVTTTSTLPTLTGTATLNPGETFTVTVNGATYLVVPTGSTWSLDLATATPVSGVLGSFMPGTSYSVVGAVTDVAGNVSTDISSNELNIAVQPVPVYESAPVVTVVNAPPVPVVTIVDAPALSTANTIVINTSIGMPSLLDGASVDQSSLTMESSVAFASSSDTGNTNLYTRSDGFQVIVLKSDSANSGAASTARDSLMLNRGIQDVQIDYTGRQIEVPIPRDAFAHTRNDATISLTVLQTNGEALPTWLIFDARLGMFRGVPPKGLHATIEIRVIARDQAGNQVETTFRIYVDEAGIGTVEAAHVLPSGKAGLSEQLRVAGKWGRSHSHDRLGRLADLNAQRARHAARG